MCMKINTLSSNRWSKMEMGGSQRPLWFYPLDHCNPPGGGPSERNSALHSGWWGTRNNPRAEAEDEKSRGGSRAPKRC